MPAAPSVGVLTQFGMGTTSTMTEKYEFISENLASHREILNTAGIRGTRSQVIERIRQGTLAPGGQVVLEPTPNELRKLLPRIMGGAESAQAGYFQYSLADSLTTNGTFYASVDRIAKVYVYNTCFIDKATFVSAQGQIMRLTLDIEALSETVNNSGSFPVLTIDATAPFTHFDGVLTLGGAAIQMMSATFTIDNRLKKDRFVNSQTRTDLPALDRVVTLECVVPYTSDTLSLYDTGAAGVTADLKYSVGGAGDGAAGTDLHWLLQNIVFPANKSPVVAGKDEVVLTLRGQVYMTGGTSEVVAKVDVTP